MALNLNDRIAVINSATMQTRCAAVARSDYFLRGSLMAAVNVQLATSDAFHRESDGRIILSTTAGGQEFASEDEFRQWIISTVADANSDGCKAVATALLAGHLLAKDPLLDSPTIWNGKTVTVDVEQALPANVFKVV